MGLCPKCLNSEAGICYEHLTVRPSVFDTATATVSTYVPCKHKKIHHFEVKFWIFKKHMIWCDDCKKAFTLRKFWENYEI